ncbi:Glucose-1-phosphate thymidylyltransferase (EC [Olavius algarvensis associated proteobacterium Delta 3]|nr:Glucose-1-phosphate thymidylyltransferase (EC [Olavius algarvensis associated proteobacterium Delta 3]
MNLPSDSRPLQGIILAAGKGVRAYPATRYIPKALMEVGGKTLIERNVEIMRQQLGIRDIIVVVGYLGDQIAEYFQNNGLDQDISFVRQIHQKGIGHAMLCAEPEVRHDRFVVMLGDEFYLDSNHRDLLAYLDGNGDTALMFREETNRFRISKNYTGVIKESRVISLEEKPKQPRTRLMGVGTYLLNRKVFDYIRNTPPSALRGEVEITDVLSRMAETETVHACMLEGAYLNVNSVDDLNMAHYILRERYFDRYRVSVVIPAYNEEETIEEVIRDFGSRKEIDEVLVVDNNSRDRTGERAHHAGARVVTETRQGYGCALRRGLDDALGDIVVLTEADGSFQAKDIPKFLQYLKDCDMVIGTRTTRQLIEQGANMEGLLRWGNVAVGKLIEALWWAQEPRFTDVGCTYRAIWKTSYEKIRPYLTASGPDFSPEMMIAVLICRRRIIEIPVSYRQRYGGVSKHSGHFRAHARTALKMLRRIFNCRMTY